MNLSWNETRTDSFTSRLLSIFTCLFLVSFGAVLADAQSATNEVKREWGKEVEGLSLSITTSNKIFSAGDRIILNVLLKNTGTNAFTLLTTRWGRLKYSDNFNKLCSIHVLLPNGKPAPLTLYGKMLADNALEFSNIPDVDLKPGEEDVFNIFLNRIFDFSMSGRYKVSVTRFSILELQAAHQSLNVISNEIELEVNQ